MAVNLKELSAHLGLSPTTVSRALGGYSDVSPVTRERVTQAAAEFGYEPNRAARQVARGRAEAIGIVYSLDADYLGNPAFLATLGAMAEQLERSGYDLLLAAASQKDEMRVYERMVRGRRVDAMLVAHTMVEDPRIDYLLRAQMPVLAYGRASRPHDFPWFDFDNEAGCALAVARLAALGHRHIAYVHAPLTLNFAFQRHAGYLAGLAETGLRVGRARVVGAGLSRRSGYEAARKLLRLKPRPTAILVDNANAGVGVIRALLDEGLAIGPQVSVLVYEGLPADTIFQGLDVAAIVQPTPQASGRTMGEMLLALVERRALEHRQVLRQPEFLSGNSIAPSAA
jgi:LacI family transcriptional regulator